MKLNDEEKNMLDEADGFLLICFIRGKDNTGLSWIKRGIDAPEAIFAIEGVKPSIYTEGI